MKYLVMLGTVITLLFTTNYTSAHQPFCETYDLTMTNPWQVPNSEVSFAFYGNVYPHDDVDYFTFDAVAGQNVLISMSIPAFEGQEDYKPTIAVFGPGIEDDLDVPDHVMTPEGQGGMIIPLGDESEYWFEPFGRDYYWNWDNYYFNAPEDATYTAILWHPEERMGRYAFVIGEREQFGGDLDCLQSLENFWTPLVAGTSPYTEESVPEDNDKVHMHEDGTQQDHGDPIDVSGESAPVVDLSVIPLGDGSYNVRVQTLNFVFAPQNVDQEPVAGEGHAHLYIDGEKIARLYGEWYHLSTLPEDAQEITVILYANNHQPLIVDGNQVSDSVYVSELND